MDRTSLSCPDPEPSGYIFIAGSSRGIFRVREGRYPSNRKPEPSRLRRSSVPVIDLTDDTPSPPPESDRRLLALMPSENSGAQERESDEMIMSPRRNFQGFVEECSSPTQPNASSAQQHQESHTPFPTPSAASREPRPLAESLKSKGKQPVSNEQAERINDAIVLAVELREKLEEVVAESPDLTIAVLFFSGQLNDVVNRLQGEYDRLFGS